MLLVINVTRVLIWSSIVALAHNVIRLCAGGALKHESFNPPLNLIKRTNDEFSR
jgi:hypothetical protein